MSRALGERNNFDMGLGETILQWRLLLPDISLRIEYYALPA
ncbi:MAG: hypothetical protein AB8B99_08610 [Phormidesmis sp.]